MTHPRITALLDRYPNAEIISVKHKEDSIFFADQGRQWVMVFEKDEPDGVWDMTAVGWDEAAAAEDEERWRTDIERDFISVGF